MVKLCDWPRLCRGGVLKGLPFLGGRHAPKKFLRECKAIDYQGNSLSEVPLQSCVYEGNFEEALRCHLSPLPFNLAKEWSVILSIAAGISL